MSLQGTTSSIPKEQRDLHLHIAMIADCIGKMVFDELHYQPSKGAISLMKDFLNTISLQSIIDSDRKDEEIKQEHIGSLAKAEHRKNNNDDDDNDTSVDACQTTDDEISQTYSLNPTSALVLTLKLFHLHLKAKVHANTPATFSNCFKTEFHLFAALVSSAWVAYKVVYDELDTSVDDIHDSLKILYSNVLRLLNTLFTRADFIDDDEWSHNIEDALEFLKIIDQYEPLNPDEHVLLDEIHRIFPNAGKAKLRDLSQQLQILTLFKTRDEASREKDDFYTKESWDETDKKKPAHKKRTDKKSIDKKSKFHFNLAVYEKRFLETIHYKVNFTFTLHEACELLSNVKKYVNSNRRLYTGFSLLLSVFGEPKDVVSFYELEITRPSERQMQCMFEHFKAMSFNPLKPNASHEDSSVANKIRTNLKTISN